MSVETCPYCDGKGITYGPRVAERKKCRTCGGTGIVITCSFCRGKIGRASRRERV